MKEDKIIEKKRIDLNQLRYTKKQIQTRMLAIKLRQSVISYLGNKCSRCGISDCRVLIINSIKDGTTMEFRKRGPQVIYKEILQGKRDQEFNLLCTNCNAIDDYEKGKRKDLKGYKKLEQKYAKKIKEKIGG